MDVAIIGTGHNGLITAYYLAKQGLDVHLFEKRDFTGGAALTEELWPGYRFSTCAHLLHLFHPRIINDLELIKRGLDVLPRRNANLHMKSRNTYWGMPDDDSPRNSLAYSRLSKEEREGIEKFETFKTKLRKGFSPYRLGLPPTLDQVRAKMGEDQSVLDQAIGSTLKDLRDHFLPSQVLRDFYADEGAPVSRNPSALFLAYGSMGFPDDETGELPANGYVRGGLGALAKVLTEAAIEAGATIHTGKAVDEIIVEADQAVGLRLEDETEVRSRIVVSNLDPKRTFLKILPKDSVSQDIRRRIAALKTNVSCYKFLAAVSELPKWEAWEGDPDEPSEGGVRLNVSEAEISASYDALEAGRPTEKPVISVSVPSIVDPTLAPEGHHTVSCYIYPAPGNLNESSWEDERERIADLIIDQINSFAPNFRNSIIHQRLRVPSDLVESNSLTDGCIWHLQHDADQLFRNRPLPEFADYRAHLKNLYLCGSGQHPGGEVSGLPGHNAAQEILKDLS